MGPVRDDFDVVDVPLVDQDVGLDDRSPAFELLEMFWDIVARLGKYRELVRLPLGLERGHEHFGPRVVPVANALPVGDRIADHHQSRHTVAMRSGVPPPAQLLAADRQVFKGAAARPAERAAAGVAIQDPKRALAREQKERRCNQQGQAANRQRSRAHPSTKLRVVGRVLSVRGGRAACHDGFLEQRVDERRGARAAEHNQDPEQQQHHQDRRQPPLLVVGHERPEFADDAAGRALR